MQLHTKIPNQIGVLDAFKDFQLVCSFLDGFMVVGLKSNLEKETGWLLLAPVQTRNAPT